MPLQDANPTPSFGGFGVRQPPSHHVPAVPVHDVHQVDESLGHGQAQVIAAVHTSMGVPARCSPCPMLHTPAGCAGLTG